MDTFHNAVLRKLFSFAISLSLSLSVCKYMYNLFFVHIDKQHSFTHTPENYFAILSVYNPIINYIKNR